MNNIFHWSANIWCLQYSAIREILHCFNNRYIVYNVIKSLSYYKQHFPLKCKYLIFVMQCNTGDIALFSVQYGRYYTVLTIGTLFIMWWKVYHTINSIFHWNANIWYLHYGSAVREILQVQYRRYSTVFSAIREILHCFSNRYIVYHVIKSLSYYEQHFPVECNYLIFAIQCNTGDIALFSVQYGRYCTVLTIGILFIMW